LGNHSRAEVFDPLQLGWKIDNRFPVGDLIDNFIPDSLNFSELIALRGENSFRLFENLEQLS
jgi:hypothetical protein